METATLTSKGQITIPVAVRDRLGLRRGDRIAFHIREDGVVEIQPVRVDLLSLCEAFEPAVQGVTLEDMEDAIRASGAVGEP